MIEQIQGYEAATNSFAGPLVSSSTFLNTGRR